MIFEKNKAIWTLSAMLLCLSLMLFACGGGQGQGTGSAEQTTEPAEDSTIGETVPEQTTNEDSATEAETETVTEPEPQKVLYTVSVTGSDGNARQGATVQFLVGEEAIAAVPTDADGVASAELLPDTYTVKIANLMGETYDPAGCELTPDSRELSVRLYGLPDAGEEIYAYSASAGDHISYMARRISEGCYWATLNSGDMTYFLFVAPREGRFKLSVSEDLPISIGYYGSTSFVLTESTVPEENNAIYVDVYDDMVYNYAFVIGVMAEEASLGACALSAEYVGERETTVNDIPWNDLMPDRTLPKYTLGAGAVTDFAVDGAEISLVYNEGDGYYHVGSEDGPAVLVNLDNNTKYMDALTTVCSNMRLGVYVYDEEGNLLSKDSYNELIWAYNEVADGGYYPLDNTLRDMLVAVGDYMGWYDPASPMYLFEGVALEPANAFLFACAYLK
ncbi:MAG: Ig-like domain-containing protein [Clostridia bacterium]|nr:Ig-like domain-containing protein [Clostridia bacterium]